MTWLKWLKTAAGPVGGILALAEPQPAKPVSDMSGMLVLALLASSLRIAAAPNPELGPASGFTDEMVARCSQLMGESIAGWYTGRNLRAQLVVLEDEMGHTANSHRPLLAPVLCVVSHVVPSLLFLALVLLACDSLLENRVCGQCPTEDWKYILSTSTSALVH